jgi:hypothetical protein
VLRLQPGVFGNLSWHAIAADGGCVFANEVPLVGPILGDCIGGGPGALQVVQRRAVTAIPAPAPVALLGLAVLGLLGWRLRTPAAA